MELQSAPLWKQHTETAELVIPRFVIRLPEGRAVVVDVALGRLLESDHVT